MAINNLIKKGRGRPKDLDPKMKLDSFRLKTSTLIDIELIAEHLEVSRSVFFQTIMENEVSKLKKILDIQEFK